MRNVSRYTKPKYNVTISRLSDGEVLQYVTTPMPEGVTQETHENVEVSRLPNGNYVITNDEGERLGCYDPREWEQLPDACFKRLNRGQEPDVVDVLFT